MLTWEELIKNREASFQSFRNIFLHIINCEDWYIHTVISNHGGKFIQYDFDSYNDIKAIKIKMDEVEEKTRIFFKKFNEDDMKEIIVYKRPDDTIRKDSIEDILIHLILEETHHRGEIIGFLWAMDIEPPHEGWLKYVLSKN
jgi:uncharacterized damage-inducible protein DinB